MEKATKYIIPLTLVLMLVFCTSTVFAALGNPKTVDVRALFGWQGGNPDGPAANKAGASTSWACNVAAKTMTSHPKIRLVNASDVARSGTVTISATGTFNGSDNTGDKGSTYWGSVYPALNQVGTDSIRFSIDPK